MNNIYPYRPAFTACFAISEASFPVHTFGENHRKITCVAPLYSKPSVTMYSNVVVNPTIHAMFVDSNVLSFVDNGDENEQVTDLFRWANANKMAISPIVAILEQLKQEISEEESAEHIRRKVRRLNDQYEANIDMVLVEHALFMAPVVIAQDRDYVGILADFFIVVRHFYHQKSTFERKCKLLANLMQKCFPQLAIAYYIACLYFYVGSNPKMFDDGKRKCQGDMEQSKDVTQARKDAHNFAFDISMITRSTMPLVDDNGAFVIPYIATGDNGLAFLLKEICFRQIHYVEGRSQPMVAYRPGSRAYYHVRETVERCLKAANPVGKIHEKEDWRRDALADAAEKVLADIGKNVLKMSDL
jgi:hypothetical protein